MHLWLLMVLGLLNVGNIEAEELNLEPVYVYASRSQQEALRLTNPVTVITSDKISGLPATSIVSMLAQDPAISVAEYGHLKNAQVDLGGFGETALSNTLVLVDGRRTNQIDLSGQDWAQIDPQSIERIEVIHSPSSVLYGDNASGGVINIITKKGKKNEALRTTIKGAVGSYKTNQQGLMIQGGRQRFNFAGDWLRYETTGYRANSDYRANDLNFHLGVDPNDTFGIDTAVGYHRDYYELPGALFPAQLASIGPTGVRSSLTHDHGWTTDGHVDLTPRWQSHLGSHDVEVSVFGSLRNRNNKFYTGSTIYETLYDTDTYEVQPKVQMNGDLSADVQQQLTIGLDGYFAQSRRRSGTLGTAQDNTYITKKTQGVYLLNQLTVLEQWFIDTGMRLGWAQYVFDQKEVLPVKTTESSRNDAYQLGLGYRYQPRSQVFMNVSKSYRLPAVDEFFQNQYDFGSGLQGGLNRQLTYQRSRGMQVGIKDNQWQMVDLNVTGSVLETYHEIYLNPATFTNTNYEGNTRRYGLDGSLALNLWGDRLKPYMGLGWQRATFHDGVYKDKRIPFVANYRYTAGVRVELLKGLTTNFAWRFEGERFAISDLNNTQPKLKNYSLLDWDVHYQWHDMEVYMSVKNLLDRQYYPYGVYSSFNSAVGFYPGDDRNITVGAKLTF